MAIGAVLVQKQGERRTISRSEIAAVVEYRRSVVGTDSFYHLKIDWCDVSLPAPGPVVPSRMRRWVSTFFVVRTRALTLPCGQYRRNSFGLGCVVKFGSGLADVGKHTKNVSQPLPTSGFRRFTLISSDHLLCQVYLAGFRIGPRSAL